MLPETRKWRALRTPERRFRKRSRGLRETAVQPNTQYCVYQDCQPSEDVIMLPNKGIIVVLLVAILGLTACVAPPPRQSVIYHEGGDQANSGRYCHTCGTVRDIDQVEIRQGNSGGGALLGAIIGG